MSEIKQQVTNQANLSGENNMNVNQISGKVSRKRKAKSEPLPGKRKRTEEKNFFVKRQYRSSPRLPRRNQLRSVGSKPKKTHSDENARCDEQSVDHEGRGFLNEENRSLSGCYTPKSSSYEERTARKRKAAVSEPLPTKRKCRENRDVLKVRPYNSSSKLSLLRRKKLRREGSRPKNGFTQPKNNDCELSLDYGENDLLNEENRSLSGCYTPDDDSDFVEDVKNSEPPEYVKQLANSADFANFEMGKLLGAGSFGEVVAATRKNDNVPVALKFVKKTSISEYKKLNGRLIPAEVYLQRLARHRYVIKIYQLIFTDEYYCFVMERPEECKDLFDIIQDRNNENKPLTEKEVRRYFAQILEANVKCEDRGVVHRDIKPENILVDMRTDEAKLIDFGLASEVQREPFTTFRGTNQYMPPEYIKTRKYDGCQGTVWQMGILLVDMLSPVVTAFEKPHHALSMAPRVPQQFSPEVKNLIATLLNTTPDNRPTLKQALKHPWFAMTD